MGSDILQSFAECLHSAGLAVEAVQADGLLHRCGTLEKPRKLDGAYKAFLDEPPSIWWKNWRTGDEGTWTAVKEKDWTARQRKELKARIEAIKKESRIAQEQRWEAAAKLASFIWRHSRPADDGHPYLTRKKVQSFGLRQTHDCKLVIPVLDKTGHIQSLQFIFPEKQDNAPDKLFLKDGRTAGGHFLIKSGEDENEPLLIVEGYATAASLHMGTGYPVMMAFSAGNLESVGKLARENYPDREIIVCADNDISTKDNPGVLKAKETAGRIGAKLAICPVQNGKSTDFNDLHCSQSLDAVRTVIEASRKQIANCPMPDGFSLITEGKRAGLYRLDIKPDGDMCETWLGPPLFIKGMTRDRDGNEWGLMLEWIDPDGNRHSWAMPIELLFRQGVEWYSILASGGWVGNPLTKKKLLEFFCSVRPIQRIRCVSRTGWDNTAYVLPDSVYGKTDGESVVLQSSHYSGLYAIKGTFEGWQEIADLSVGNSRLGFALCAAFAGPLLHLAGMEGGGFSFEGGSSSGKTTALQVAASVWGGPEHVRTWRATDNGLELIASLHNDNMLILDEVGQVNSKVLAECAYMLANGQGKSRSNREGSLRKSTTWRLLFLSSGELGLADKLAENGLKSRGGQEVRFVGLPVDSSMLYELHGHANAGSLANRLKELSATHYGHAGRAFLKKLCEPQNMDMVINEIIPSLPDTVNSIITQQPDGQVLRVARRFALCGLAGDLAVKFGILPPDFDAIFYAAICFLDWINARGGSGASEDAEILSTVRLFIEQHGVSRFQDIDNLSATCINRVGFRREIHGRTEYIILPESFRAEVVKGYSPRRAGQVLRKAGWLNVSDGKSTTKRELPGLGRVRAYVVNLPEEMEEENTF